MNIDEFELRYLMFLADVKNSRSYLPNLEYMLEQPKSQEVVKVYGDKLQVLESTYADCLCKFGSECKDPKEAFSYFSKALNYRNTPELLIDLARCLTQMNYLDLARAYCFRASLITPDHPKLLEVQSLIEHYSGNYSRAIDYLRKLDSSDPDVNYRLSTYLIEERNFSEGWKLYESRFTKKNSPAPYPDFSVPRWDKFKPSGNLLVHWEQGYGDSIMFSRFLPLLKPYAKKIYFAVRQPMFRLMKQNFQDIHVILDDSIPEDVDYHLPLMSIMDALNIQPENIDGKSYLSLNESVSYYQRTPARKIVGFAWQGSPAGSPERNASLLDFEPLLKRKDLSFISFQKGFGLAQAKPLFQDLNILDVGSGLEDFYSTAYALSGVDIVVSTDNCIANLAGALGIQTFLLLNKNSEFRWMHADKTTEWYDSVTIIKQDDFGDWSSCISELNSRI